MSITAFPVLARILEDRELTQTQLGSMRITVPPSTMSLPGASWRS
jgi:hypothetical protein